MDRYIQIVLLTLLLSLFAGGRGSAQVTVGSTNPPASFSSLQIDGNGGGLRLPQLSEIEKGALNADSSNAGLMIYNRNKDRIEYWDGASWLAVGDTLKIYNGIHQDGNVVKLGGKLTENTSIDFNHKQLQFTTGNNGSYSVGDTIVVVGNKIVSIKPEKLTVNDELLSIEGRKVEVTMNDIGERFTSRIGKSVLSVTPKDEDTGSVLVDTRLQYKDGNQGSNKVLLSKALGDAYWGLLKPEAIIKTGTIKAGGTVVNNLACISDSITLESGKWLVFAKFSTSTSSGTKMFSWGDLMAYDGTSGWLVSSIGADVDNSGLAFPQIVYLMVLEKQTKIYIRCSTSNNPTKLTDDYGKPTFFAILIDKPLE